MLSEHTTLWNETLRNHRSGLIVTTAAILGTGVILRSSAQAWFWIWFFIALGFTVLRVVLYQACLMDARRSPAEQSAALKMLHNAGVLGAGLIWAALAWLGVPHFEGHQQFAVLIILSALAGGATGTLASLKLTGKIYIALLIGAPCMQLALKGDVENSTLSALGFLFAGIMINNHANNYRLLVRSIALGKENLGLVEELSSKTALVLQANADLELRVSERTRELYHAAHHDLMTGLPNRVLTQDRFHQAMAQAAREGSKVALLYVDLDNFKFVNDSFGHRAGDQLLCTTAARLQESVRESDTVSRQGGDEFLVILPNLTDVAVALRVAAKIREALNEPFNIAGQTIGVSASIGVTLSPDHGADFDVLLRNADVAMYVAKRDGRNAFRLFSEEMNVDSSDKLKLQAQLSRALDKHEFFLVYQPQISLKTMQIVGAEALIRWQHPAQGVVSPLRFIALAEESGLIGPIGHWVIREACQQAKVWLDGKAPGLVMAVNVSAYQLNSGSILDSVQTILAENHFPPDSLELEFTESGLLRDVAQSLQTMEMLKSLGVKMSIDDFGTGYSSLSYLRQFQVESLKIDQSFIQGIGESTESLEIIRAIIQLGKTLNLKVTAEGVETEEQLDALRVLGCDSAQGFLISKPVSAEQFAALL